MKKHNTIIYIAAAASLIMMLLHFFGVGMDTVTLILFFSTLCIFLLPVLSKFKIFGVIELEKAANEIRELKTNFYRGKVVKDESNRFYFIDKKGNYHLLPDKETAQFLETEEGQIEIKKKELQNSYKQGEEFGSVLDKNTKIIWINRTHIFVILDGKRFHVPSWDYLYSWKRSNRAEFIDVAEEDLYKYPDGK